MQNWSASSLIMLYLWIDALISILSFGFYGSSFQFTAQLIWLYLLFREPYHFGSSPVDFLVLTAFRAVVLLVCITLKLKYGVSVIGKGFIPLFGVFILNWTFSLIKLLAFSENVVQLGYFGFWLSTVWNVLAAFLLILLWYFVLCANVSWSYQTLVSRGTHDAAGLLEDKEQPIRRGTFEHALRLLKYCKYQWKWFTAGFFFLTVYSSCKFFMQEKWV